MATQQERLRRHRRVCFTKVRNKPRRVLFSLAPFWKHKGILLVGTLIHLPSEHENSTSYGMSLPQVSSGCLYCGQDTPSDGLLSLLLF
jgi:hypothetical protein